MDKKEFEPPVESGITSTLFWAVSKIRSFTSINTSISASTPPTIGDTETKTVVNGVYPKLKALKALLENLDDTVDPVFKYGYLINLGNSKDEYKKALKETEQFNEFLASLDDAKSSGTPAQKSPVNSARVAEIDRARDASHRLFNALAHLPTECGVSHRAMLHLTGFKQRDRGSLRPAYDMFVSCCPKSLEWLESHCLISDPIDYPEATSIVELCGAVQDYRQTPKALRLILGGEHLFDARAKDGCFEYPKFRHHLSLGTLLDKGCFKSPYDGGLFTTRSKRLLVLNLARCLLCLFGSKWLQREWKASDIVFLCEPGGDHLVDMHRPYILSTLSPAVPPLREIRDSSSVPHHPAILSFAKLLVEIERGRRITKGEYELSAGRENQWLTISTILSRQLFESLTGYYMNAVKSCLDFARPAGYGSNSEVDYIYQNIVMPLEKELSHYPGAQLENAELRLLSTNLNMTSTGRPATAASMACHLPTAAITEPPSPTLQTRIVQDVRLGTLANPTETTLVLFDDNEDNGPESRINRFRASEFLDDLEDSENGSEVKIDSQTTIISSKAKPETHQSKANENSPLASPTTGKSSRRKLDHKNTKSSGSTLSIDRPTVRSRSVPPPDLE
ncbi:hypothetical protein K469DRAFT_62782 [Zopfia rhizophila CBS 207.26]|uniref:DUF7580 domain-containing protein n=1 Tax=Zopfia rhizophila CBS 207.26 TaxID=1314779 RepID=A0A6A6EBS7_9PEZI|nr:hypothetical protein K469DRAFT_62782 [Zopfia rhizophila CBS 207.26]